MKKSGRKNRPKRSRPVHGRQSKKRLQQEVKAVYGRESAKAAEDDDRDWQDWEPAPGGNKPAATVSSSTATEPPAPPLSAAATAADGPLAGIVGLASGLCWVEVDGERHQAALPSRLARNQRSHLAVGDIVRLTRLDDGTWRVEEVRPRRTELSRPDPHNPRQQRLIAANIDEVVIVASVVAPPLRPALIDRYLITVDQGGARPLLAINKIDLLNDTAEHRRQLAPLDAYREQGLRVVLCSTEDGRGIDTIRSELAGRTAVVVGHSGVGKSSLLNALDPTFRLRTGEVNEAGSGRHTTTRSGLYALQGDIRLIDTPGIRELGLGALDPRELQFYFPELIEWASQCRFGNCTHLHEPDCAVRRALSNGDIDGQRFQIYRRLLMSLEEEDPGH